ncbi:beta-L-arabinofuranosidase domain-containing protein [Microbacterium hominis]|uniref:Glycoside hydrolase family 127 protein n=1 Tax=Microbacterium hominis TaxID=162426 RepID=A0A7D4Q2W4_9MICO|nr:beta-L-arabinofuranosidase domain-containing protein [Microbacterium hominis]QKJ20592.1 glycoside hydrolase family 127 protein [Microbacterium hominis]
MAGLSTFVPLGDVRLLEGPDASAQRTVSATLQRLDPERLLAPFRREAGLTPHAEPYPGWESDGLDGHTAGHVLTAASQLAAQGDAAARALAAHIVAGMRACQVAIGTGYVGGVPDGAALWDELAAGRVEAGAFHLNGRWVPLYNLHKTLAGLLDAAQLAAIPDAETAVAAFGDWWLAACARLDDPTLQTILRTEFGGIPDALARLALHRRDRALLDLARRFVPDALVEPLAAGRDELDGLHANTQIPVVVGFAAIERAAAVLAPDLAADIAAREGAAARTFFAAVAHRRSSAIGGDSVREHFPADALAMFTAREGPETCNTHNMVRLAGELHLLTGDDRYLLWAENARINHLRSAQHPEHGGLVYFTSQRPAHYRVYSPEAEGFWCCMGSGFEAQSRHAAQVFSVTGDGVLQLNAFPAAEARWNDGVVSIAPADGVDVWHLTATTSTRVSVLIPDWVDGVATVDGAMDASAGSRVALELAAGEGVELRLPRRLRVERMPGAEDWGWVVDGPHVLAQRIPDDTVSYRGDGARLGHIATGPLRRLAETPVLEPELRAVRLGDGRVRVVTDVGPVDLEPFAHLHDARYTLAWPLGDPATRRDQLAAIDAASLELDARTRDVIRFGEQQPESDHGLTATDELTGIDGGERWRATRGTITVTLRDWSGAASHLLLAGAGGDVRVRVRDTVLHEGAVDASGTAIPLPPGGAEVEHTVHLESAGGEPTARLTELRLMAEASD